MTQSNFSNLKFIIEGFNEILAKSLLKKQSSQAQWLCGAIPSVQGTKE